MIIARTRGRVHNLYDPLWDGYPKVKKIRAESKTEGATQALQMVVVNIVKIRYPDLVEQAQQKVAQIDNPDVLNYLIEQITSAPDESVVRFLLHPTAA